MPQLKNREKRLLFMFGGIVVILANYMLWDKMLQTKKQIEEDRKGLSFQIKEADLWMQQKDEAESKKEWITQNQPALDGTAEQATSKLLDFAKSQATENKLTITKNTLGKAVSSPIYEEVSVNLKATGSMENITKWAHAIYDHSEFRLFKEFTLRNTPEADKLELTATVAQWFKPSNENSSIEEL